MRWPAAFVLRPVLMTSLATIIGLLPMALKLGAGSEAYAPLARAILGGLSVSVSSRCCWFRPRICWSTADVHPAFGSFRPQESH